MAKELVVDSKLKLTLVAADVYCWAMSFFVILTNKSIINLRNYFTKYKIRSEADYKGFMEVLRIGFSSVKSKNPKEAELMIVASNLLIRALQYKLEERPIIKNAIREMKKFEKEKKYKLNSTV